MSERIETVQDMIDGKEAEIASLESRLDKYETWAQEKCKRACEADDEIERLESELESVHEELAKVMLERDEMISKQLEELARVESKFERAHEALAGISVQILSTEGEFPGEGDYEYGYDEIVKIARKAVADE